MAEGVWALSESDASTGSMGFAADRHEVRGKGAGLEPERAFVAEAHARFGAGLRRFFQLRVGSFRGDSGRDLALIEELCQQTWGECWKCVRERKYDPSRAALSTFLYAIASNVWLRHRRHSIRQGERPGDADAALSLIGAEADPARTVAFSELLEAVLRRVSGEEGGLSAEDRTVLVALARGASDRDLAEQLRVAPSTAHARRRAALGRLRRALAEMGFEAGDENAERS